MFTDYNFFKGKQFTQTLYWLKEKALERENTFSALELCTIQEFYQEGRNLLTFMTSSQFPLEITKLLASELEEVLDYAERLLQTYQSNSSSACTHSL